MQISNILVSYLPWVFFRSDHLALHMKETYLKNLKARVAMKSADVV